VSAWGKLIPSPMTVRSESGQSEWGLGTEVVEALLEERRPGPEIVLHRVAV
jgi:hypothetical protein